VPEPEASAFREVQKVFAVGGDWFVIAGWLCQKRTPARRGVLWRLREGKWQKLLDGIDEQIEFVAHPERPLLATDEGLWLGAYGSGGWFIPRDNASPVQLNWQFGMPLTNIHRLFALSDGRLLAVAFTRGSVAFKPTALLAAAKPARAIRAFQPYRRVVQSPAGRIWAVLFNDDNTLSEWEGNNWVAHMPPGPHVVKNTDYLTVDSEERVWWLAHIAAIFDPAKNSWDIFDSYQAALVAQTGRSLQAWYGDEQRMIPSFAADGRICFRDGSARVSYHDGKSWRTWNREHIKGDKSTSFDGPPFFSRAGRLAVNIDQQTWEFAEQRGWETTGYEPQARDLRRIPPAEEVLPPEAVTPRPDSIVRDARGAHWLTRKGQLYKVMHGLCVQQFEPDEAQPFLDGRKLASVLIDQRGNAFLMSHRQGGPEYVILPAPAAPPSTGVKVVPESPDTFKLHFSTTAPGKAWFVWRLDDGPWSAARSEPVVRLEMLPTGRHRIEVAAIDERLRIDPKPAEAILDVQLDPAQQVAGLIAALADKNAAKREGAVAALCRQPDRALPALRAARAAAGTDQRWWIDVAIQQIEEAKRKASR
jgi:hypothetical protein